MNNNKQANKTTLETNNKQQATHKQQLKDKNTTNIKNNSST